LKLCHHSMCIIHKSSIVTTSEPMSVAFKRFKHSWWLYKTYKIWL